MAQDLWCFKYAPQTLDDMILSDDMKATLRKIIDECPNVLLAGKPGTGKGTFMDILLKETGYDYMKINASDENSVDDVRDKIKSFATSLGFTDKKIVYLNECLEENEEIILGTVEKQYTKKLKDLNSKEIFEVVSMNQKTGKLENDIGYINVDKMDEIFKVELEDGRTIQANGNHPFFILEDGKIKTKLLKDLSEEDEILTF